MGMARIVPAKPPTDAAPKTPGAMALQLFAVFGAPGAWLLQLVADYALSAEACFPNDTPLARPDPALAWDRPALIAINLLALAAAVLATALAAAVWRRNSRRAGSREDPVEIARGRSRFLAGCGLLTGFGFMAAILFNTVAAIGVPQCSG